MKQHLSFPFFFFGRIAQIHTETIVDNGLVLPADKPIFSKYDAYIKRQYNSTQPYTITSTTLSPSLNVTVPDHVNAWTGDDEPSTNGNTKFDFESGGFMLKRLPVRDGEHGYYRHVVFVSTADQRAIPLTMGRFEVTELLGWDELNEIIYFMATPKLKPGQRHLYKISLTLNVTHKPNRMFLSATQPICLTCDNTIQSFRIISNNETGGNISSTASETEPMTDETIPNNCLYNKIYFSRDFTYYVQECLGPDSPSVYLVETQTSLKLLILHSGDLLRNRISQLAVPQMRTFDVEIRHGFHAQVRLFLPPGMKEEEEVAFPLILHM